MPMTKPVSDTFTADRIMPAAKIEEGMCTAVRKPSSGAPAFVPARAA